jgi:hypothetical protein
LEAVAAALRLQILQLPTGLSAADAHHTASLEIGLFRQIPLFAATDFAYRQT